MDKNFQIIKRENESLEKIDKRPVLLVNDIAKLVNSSALIKPVYKSVKIGNQTWMVENLNVAHYRNGDSIPEVKDKDVWKNLKTGAWCYYDNDPENGKKYGKLYNWYAVNDDRGLAPEGWHIPIKEELETLKAAVSNDSNAVKAVGQGAGTNTDGFSALLAGVRYSGGGFYDLGYGTKFWSSTEYGASSAYCLGLGYGDSNVVVYGNGGEGGFSIRCLKD